MRIFPRTWLQFSLRTFLVLISVTALVGGLAWIKYRDDREFEARRDHWLSIGYKLEVEETPVWLGLHTRRKIVGLWTDSASEYYDENRLRLDGIEAEGELRRVFLYEGGPTCEQCEALVALPKLQKLYLFCSDINVATVEKLSRLPQLTQLSIMQSFLDSKSILDFNKLPALQELSLTRSYMFNEGLDQLRIPTLERLDVSDCPLGKLDLSKSGFGGMLQLKELIVQRGGIKEIIVDATKLKLRRLDLRGNPLTRLQGLAAAAPELETLLINFQNLNPGMIADLRELKNLKKMILSAGYPMSEHYLDKWLQLEKDLPGIASHFDFPVLIEDFAFKKSPQVPTYRAPASFGPELPLITAGK